MSRQTSLPAELALTGDCLTLDDAEAILYSRVENLSLAPGEG